MTHSGAVFPGFPPPPHPGPPQMNTSMKAEKSPCNVVPSIGAVRLPGLDHRQGVPNSKLAFEVQRGAHSCQPPLHHDGNAVTQHISFFHAVCRQHDGSVLPVLLDHIPCEPGHTHQALQKKPLSVLSVRLRAFSRIPCQPGHTHQVIQKKPELYVLVACAC